MASWHFASRTPEETFALGRELGRSIGTEGLVIALVGPLGAGKTLLVKGLAEGLGLDPRTVSSPTFVIAQQYPLPEGPEILHHVDLYRLEDESELDGIGFDDLFADGAVLAVEWADRFPGVLGEEVLRIELEGPAEVAASEAGEADRASPARIGRVTATGALAQRVLADWRERAERVARVVAEGELRASGGSAAGRVVRMRLLLAVAWGVWVAGQSTLEPFSGLVPDPDRAPPCGAWRPLERDAVGTRVVACVDAPASLAVEGSDPIERVAGTVGPDRIEGVARWLRGERVDLRTIPIAQLEALPGIGPKRARAIVDVRDREGFASLSDLERVPGIGALTRLRLERWLRIGGAQTDAAGAPR